MTEEEWLTGTDPFPMLTALKDRSSDRKLRLFGVACCRHIWEHLPDERSREMVLLAESFADNAVTSGQLADAFEAAGDAYDAIHYEGGDQDAASAVLMLRQELQLELLLEWMAESVAYATNAAKYELLNDPSFLPGQTRDEKYESLLEEGRIAASRIQSDLLRDIFGNPFRPVVFDPAWRSESAVGVARGIYEDRAFERMPILADALQDAGCDHADILTHCREPGTRVRGCWVVDLVLGKS